MHVLPVMDVKQGAIVRGVAGERHRYRPIESRIAPDSRPANVARALTDTFGFREVYLADLDAIEGGPPSWNVYEQVAGCGFKIILDAGVTHPQRGWQLQEFAATSGCLSGIVVGLESVLSQHALIHTATKLDPDLAIFSLDLKNGHPITRVGEWQQQNPLEIAAIAVAAGFHRLIVLDLAAVGMNIGPTTTTLCHSLRSAYPRIELLSGGGVRSSKDIQTLIDAGCNRVLVASALHDGRMDARDVSVRSD